MKKIGILGYGEVGKAIRSFYDEVSIQDPEFGSNFVDDEQFDILHVCIPYQTRSRFIDVLKPVIEKHAKGALVFIHSTVSVGTTFDIHTKVHYHVVHAPIRGIHPNLAEGMKTFPMYVGAETAGVARVAGEHLESIGIEPFIVHRSMTSEMMKLLDTTYYGVAIAYHAYADSLCKRMGLNFDMVMTEANGTYNAGYMKLGKSNVMRPVLYAPEDGKIGGHCVVQNAKLLQSQFNTDPLLEAVLRHQ